MSKKLIKIDIYFDPICPWCMIGWYNLKEAMKERRHYQFDLHTSMYRLNLDMPDEGMDRTLYLSHKFGSTEAANNVYEHIRASGKKKNILFNFDMITRTPNTTKAHKLIEWTQMVSKSTTQLSYVIEELFHAFFIEGHDISEDAILKNIFKRFNTIYQLASYDYGDMMRRIDVSALEQKEELMKKQGFSGVPFFIINDAYIHNGAIDSHALLPIIDQAPSYMKDT